LTDRVDGPRELPLPRRPRFRRLHLPGVRPARSHVGRDRLGHRRVGQKFLIEARPDIYHITDHYRGYLAVLAQLRTLGVDECRLRLRNAWHLRAPKAPLKLHPEV